MKKWIVGIIVIVVLVWIGVSVSDEDTKTVEAGPIKVGIVLPLSGDAAAYGEPARNVTELAIEKVNNEGGINGRTLEAIYEDGACSGPDTANAVRKLIDIDNVKVISGGVCSSAMLSAVPIAAENNVLIVSQAASSPDLTGVSDLFVRTYPSDAAQGVALADVSYNDKEWRKVAFMQESLDYPLGIFNAFTENFESLGGETFKEEFPSSETDFRTSLTKLRAAEPDALFIDSQTPAVGERILQQVVELGWDVPLLLSDALGNDTETVARNAQALEGALSAEFSIDPDNEKFQNLVTSYKEQYAIDLPFQSYGQTEYDAVLLLADALRAVGEDPSAMVAWIKDQTDWEGASGIVIIGEDGDRVGGHRVKVITNGVSEPYLLTE